MKHTINATEFKARCLEFLDQVNSGQVEELAVTKRGQVVARLVAPHRPPASLAEWQAMMHGSVTIPHGLDVTAAVSEMAWEASESLDGN